jgi:hypothetical protein
MGGEERACSASLPDDERQDADQRDDPPKRVRGVVAIKKYKNERRNGEHRNGAAPESDAQHATTLTERPAQQPYTC